MNSNLQAIFRQELFTNPPPNELAAAIQKSIRCLIDLGLITEDGVMCLLDAEQRMYWNIYDEEIAAKAVVLIRNEILHPNEIKPWQQCANYSERFSEIARQPWKGAHSAINGILKEIDKCFKN